jgi:hypothetical protein
MKIFVFCKLLIRTCILFTCLIPSSRFRKFGPLRYARVTRDHESGRSRGTGFACFWKVEDADAALAEADRVKAEAGLEGNVS